MMRVVTKEEFEAALRYKGVRIFSTGDETYQRTHYVNNHKNDGFRYVQVTVWPGTGQIEYGVDDGD